MRYATWKIIDYGDTAWVPSFLDCPQISSTLTGIHWAGGPNPVTARLQAGMHGTGGVQTCSKGGVDGDLCRVAHAAIPNKRLVVGTLRRNQLAAWEQRREGLTCNLWNRG